MKRITAYIAVLISICLTACRPTPSGMEKAFGCEVGKTTIEEFCQLFPDSSIERVWRWTLGDPTAFLRGGEPDRSGLLYRSEELDITIKEGSYYGNVYQHIRMGFDNGVLSDIGFTVYGSADEIDSLITFFREEFSQYYKYEAEKPASEAGIDHHQIFFDDGLTTLLLWKRDYSQSEPSEFGPPEKIGVEISILDNSNKSNMHHLREVRLKKSKKRK